MLHARPDLMGQVYVLNSVKKLGRAGRVTGRSNPLTPLIELAGAFRRLIAGAFQRLHRDLGYTHLVTKLLCLCSCNIQSSLGIYFILLVSLMLGVYVPTLAFEAAKEIKVGLKPILNFKVRPLKDQNLLTNTEIDGNALVPFAHGMTLISDDLFKLLPILI